MKVEKKIFVSQLITRISFALLLITLPLNLWLQSAPIVIYFLALGPLGVFIPGVIRGDIRTLIWICFVLLMYFAIATYKLSGPQPGSLDILESILVFILFIAASVNSRLRQKNSIALY